MIMKSWNIWKLFLLAALVLAAWCSTGTAEVQASGITTSNRYPYTIHKYTKNYGTGKPVTGRYEYQLPQLKGKTKAIKKINNALKKGYRASLKDKKALAGYVESAGKSNSAMQGSYFSTTSCKVTYNKQRYVSFCFHHEWYAGGVHNGWTDGMTFNVKTGKKLTVADVVPGNAKAVKQKIINKYFNKFPAKKSDSYARKELNQTKISKFQFYLKNKNIIVGFGPYQPGGGNGESHIVLKGNY